MTEPSGKIVARPMVTRSCGHQQEFQHYEVDKYRPQERVTIGRATILPEGSVIALLSRVGQLLVGHRESAATGREFAPRPPGTF